MKIYALIENMASSPELAPEHGLSLYIKIGEQHILFDTGAGGKFADNAVLMGLDLSRIDFAFLSHGHYDHGGGIGKFFELNDRAPVYIAPLTFGQYCNAKGEYIGVDRNLEGNPRLIVLNRPLTLGSAELYPCFAELRYPLNSTGLTEQMDDGLKPDRFLHEQYMLLRENGRKILLSGCSHRGILNITEHFRPDVLIGGFHYMKQKIVGGKNAVLDEAAKILSEFDCLYYTCHCTGLSQYAYLKERMGGRLDYIATGQSINL